jgi:Dolichyl-phosphate-mannose-protein mannosyltransferase
MRRSSPNAYVASLLAILAAAVAARVFYYTYGQLRFDAETLDSYFQFVDPLLLRTELLETVSHLHSQPPLFNLFLGVVLKVFGESHELAFNVVYLGSGLVLVLSMFHLQLRLGVVPPLAAVVTGLFAVSPVTVLYENWLYPTYLVAALLTLATLLLHRYLTHERLGDAVGFFAVLGTVVLTRGMFHPLWLLLPGLVLLLAMPNVRRRTTIGMAIPLSLVVGASVVHYSNFGSLNNGEIYQDINLAQMTTLRLPPETLERLIREGKISPINRLSIYDSTLADYLPYVSQPPRTGIAVLDRPSKSTGAANWHSAWFMRIAEQYGADGRFVLRSYPGTYVSSVRDNFERFLLPSDQSRPFLLIPDSHRMWPLLRAWDIVIGGQLHYKGIALLNIAALSAAVAFGYVFFGRWLFRYRRTTLDTRSARADALTVLFMLYTFLFIAAVTIAFSSNDHSRYRFEAAPLVCVLLAMLASEVWRRRRDRHAPTAADGPGIESADRDRERTGPTASHVTSVDPGIAAPDGHSL